MECKKPKQKTSMRNHTENHGIEGMSGMSCGSLKSKQNKPMPWAKNRREYLPQMYAMYNVTPNHKQHLTYFPRWRRLLLQSRFTSHHQAHTVLVLCRIPPRCIVCTHTQVRMFIFLLPHLEVQLPSKLRVQESHDILVQLIHHSILFA